MSPGRPRPRLASPFLCVLGDMVVARQRRGAAPSHTNTLPIHPRLSPCEPWREWSVTAENKDGLTRDTRPCLPTCTPHLLTLPSRVAHQCAALASLASADGCLLGQWLADGAALPPTGRANTASGRPSAPRQQSAGVSRLSAASLQAIGLPQRVPRTEEEDRQRQRSHTSRPRRLAARTRRSVTHGATIVAGNNARSPRRSSHCLPALPWGDIVAPCKCKRPRVTKALVVPVVWSIKPYSFLHTWAFCRASRGNEKSKAKMSISRAETRTKTRLGGVQCEAGEG